MHDAKARFSITVGNTKTIRAAIERIPESAWKTIKYRDAVWDQDEARWVCEAEIAEVEHTAFTSKKQNLHVTARLIVRRVKRLNPTSVPEGQSELFATYRHHAFLTDNPLVIEQAEPMHRHHAVIEQVFADLEDGPLGHLPSGTFPRAGSTRTPRGWSWRARRSTSPAPQAPLITVRARFAPGALECEVGGGAADLPVVYEAGVDDEHHRGLSLVDALTDDWRVSARPGGGKTVAFTVRTDEAQPDSPPCALATPTRPRPRLSSPA